MSEEKNTCFNCRYCHFKFDENGKIKSAYCNCYHGCDSVLYYEVWGGTELDSVCGDWESIYDV